MFANTLELGPFPNSRKQLLSDGSNDFDNSMIDKPDHLRTIRVPCAVSTSERRGPDWRIGQDPHRFALNFL
jgi:hypothetical protein